MSPQAQSNDAVRVLVGGASGFIGSALCRYLRQCGCAVSVLVSPRDKSPRQLSNEEIFWDTENEILSPNDVENFNAIINLAGENIFGRWNNQKKEKILSSRIKSTRLIVNTIAKLKNKPEVLINTSAVGYYGINPSTQCDEDSPQGDGFLAQVCRDWENASQAALEYGVRVVNPRFAIVLDPSGGVWKKSADSIFLGVSIYFGPPSRQIPWISLTDLIHAIHWCISHKNIQGAVNFCAPSVTTAKLLAQKIAAKKNVFLLIPLPPFLTAAFGGEMAKNLLLSNSNILPKKLLASGFQFLNPSLPSIQL